MRRLAVQVEDHPLSYLSSEGRIPEGQYGTGTVRIWDRGTYTLEWVAPDELVFALHGVKLQGRFVLVRMAHRPADWLLLKLRPA